MFINNKAGKTLLHLSRYAKEGDTFEYTFDAPKAGKYLLVADVATPKPNQKLFATANGGSPVEMALPYTIGLWGKTAPFEVELKAGTIRPCWVDSGLRKSLSSNLGEPTASANPSA